MKINENLTTGFWIQVSSASLTGILLMVTLISREWVELVSRIDPDGGSGALEWAIMAALFFWTVVFTLLSRFEGCGSRVQLSEQRNKGQCHHLSTKPAAGG